jgi:hypothetical protein
MLRSAGPNHEFYEELAALAALGQISSEEYRLLKMHLGTCEVCRSSHADFMEILHEHLPILDSQANSISESFGSIPSDPEVRRRFSERARSLGIQFSPEILLDSPKREQRTLLPGFSWLWQIPRLGYAVGILVLGLIAGGLGYQVTQLKLSVADKSIEAARLAAEVANLESYRQASPRSSERERQPVPGQDLTGNLETQTRADGNPLVPELSRVRQNYQVALARSRVLDEQLQTATVELATLRSEVLRLRDKGADSERLAAAEAALRQTTDELSKLRQERDTELATIADQRAQIQKLMDKLNNQGEVLDRHMELVATTREIRDLMGARNLHIIDVADVDSRGTQKPFGRVFYTEGKSLIFYAYDLEKKKKSLERFSFQAWGQQESKSGSVQNLGVFSTDDQAQNRWVLKYDDPSVLAQIDSVFVTVEPKGGSMKPKGEQLMWAYLRATPNHP